MPNWCDNRLSVRGEPARVAAFMEAIAGEGTLLSFERIRPVPEDLPEGGAEDLSLAAFVSQLRGVDEPTNAYSWRIRFWGTKWEPESVWREDGPDEGHRAMEFSTAWSPAAPIARLLMRAWPDLEIQFLWSDPGDEAGGCLTGAGGEIREEEPDPGFEHEWFLARGWDVWRAADDED